MQKREIIIVIFLLSIIHVNSLACDCDAKGLKENQARSFKYSPIIFVGDVLFADQKTGTYEIKIVEVFKGEIKTPTIAGKVLTSCSGLPKNGRWIIYADSVSNGMIDFSMCGLSRSFENPHDVNVKEYEIPPPPTKEYETDSKFSIQANINLQRNILNLKAEALTDLELEIEELRKMK
jgi:hypothetical protein